MPNFFVNLGKPLFNEDVESYLEYYNDYIKLVIRKNYYLKNSFEDIEQSIILELLRVYPKKYKYNDFDFVTKTIIRRRVIDHRSNIIKKSNEVVLESDSLHTDINDYDSVDNCMHFVNRSLEDSTVKESNNKIIELVKHIQHLITKDSKLKTLFSDFDKQFMEVVLELYEYGHECTREEIMSCMGFELSDSQKFNSKLTNFRSKIQKHITEKEND